MLFSKCVIIFCVVHSYFAEDADTEPCSVTPYPILNECKAYVQCVQDAVYHHNERKECPGNLQLFNPVTEQCDFKKKCYQG